MESRRFQAVKAVTALALLASMIVAAPLWTTGRDFPLVPVPAFWPNLPPPFDTFALFALIGLLVVSVARVPARPFLIAFLILAVFVALGDANRWQPWFYQDVLLLAALATVRSATSDDDTGRSLDACRVVIAFTYVWSGLHKFNFGFQHSSFAFVFQPVLDNLEPGFRETVLKLWFVPPAVEALLGFGLLWGKTRNVAVVGLVAMHAFLLAMLGPWGRDYNSSVWPWNVGNALLVLTLFWKADRFRLASGLFRRQGDLTKSAAVVLMGLLPSLCPFGLWPPYFSAALYTGDVVQAIVVLDQERAFAAPPSLAGVLRPDPEGSAVNVGKWALAAMNAPVFPDEQVIRRVCRTLSRPGDGPGRVRIMFLDRPGWTGPLLKRRWVDLAP